MAFWAGLRECVIVRQLLYDSLDQFAGELIGGFPGLDILVARNLVNKAWQDIRDEGYGHGSPRKASSCPPIVTAGLATATNGSDQVVGDATAPLLGSADHTTPPLASTSLGQGRQFRIATGAPIYNIVDFDA